LQVRAGVYLDQRDFTRAAAMLAELEPLVRQMFPPDHVMRGLLASSQALLASGKGNSEEALHLANKAVDILERSIKAKGQGSDYLPIILIRRSTIELVAAQPVLAEADAERALAQAQSGGSARNIFERYRWCVP
jgi:hypothetical protein